MYLLGGMAYFECRVSRARVVGILYIEKRLERKENVEYLLISPCIWSNVKAGALLQHFYSMQQDIWGNSAEPDGQNDMHDAAMSRFEKGEGI